MSASHTNIDLEDMRSKFQESLAQEIREHRWEGAKSLIGFASRIGTTTPHPVPPYFINRFFDFIFDDGQTTPLIAACRENQVEVVQALIDAGASVDFYGSIFSMKPLTVVSANNNTHLAKMLINASPKSHTSSAAFEIACRENSLEVVEMLFTTQYGKNEYFRPTSGFFQACLNGHLDVIRFLLEKCSDVKGLEDHGWGLQAACRNGHFDVARFLLKAGFSVDTIACDGTTPLMEMAADDWNESVKFLVEAGANLNYSYKSFGIQVEGIVLSATEPVNFEACTVSLELLPLGHWGGSPPLPGDSSFLIVPMEITPFHYACAHGSSLETLDALIEANNNTITEYGNDALILAIIEDHIDVVKFIFRNGYHDSNQGKPWFEMPLHCACYCGKPEIVRWLIEEQGVDTHRLDSEKKTAKQIAQEHGHLDIVDIFRDRENVLVNRRWKLVTHLVQVDFFTHSQKRSNEDS